MADTFIAFNGSELEIDRTAYLSKHDVVNLSPVENGYDAFPIGNGDLGAMGWTPADRVFFQINKTNTWDDAPPGLFGGWEDARNPDKSEKFTSLRSCAQFWIEPGLPVFDWMYLESFEARLSLHDARAHYRAEGPLGTVVCSAFVAKDPPVLVIHYEDQLSEPVERQIVLARWGSRVFEHWYRFVRREFHLGMEMPAVGCDHDEAWLLQKTRSLEFAVAAKLSGVPAQSYQRNSRELCYRVSPGTRCSLDAYVSVVTSEEAADPLSQAREHVRRAAEAGRDALYNHHRERWRKFWSASFVQIPDDYVENLWYVNNYQIGSSALGEYPPHFIGSIWSWNRDCRPWNHYFQWNQQHYTWPLHASGHPELMMPYAKWKKESLPGAKEAARIAHGCEGAFYSDISDRRGNQAATEADVIRNLGATALTGLDMLRHYEYTLDEEYLKTYLYPVLREIVRFYICKLEKLQDGLYHILDATANEGHIKCRDTTNDLAGIRKLFPAFIAFSERLEQDEDYDPGSSLNDTGDTELRRTAAEVLENLAPYPFTHVPEDVEIWGDLKPGDNIIAFGIEDKSNVPAHPWIERPYWAPQASSKNPNTYHAVNAQLTPVFPANLVGKIDEGTELYEGCRNAALCFDPVANSGHTPLPICYARLGLTDKLYDILNRWVDDYQIFSQGLFCYFKRDNWEEFHEGFAADPYSACEHKVEGLTNEVKVIFGDAEETSELPRRPFAHVGLEAGSVLEATVNEMLLQSYDGVIRVFPATPPEWDCRFTLHAVGGFVVTSERVKGEPVYIAVESRKGQRCRIVNPWQSREKISIREGNGTDPFVETTGEGEIAFDTEPGKTYIVERESRPLSSYSHAALSASRNDEPKSRGRATLGISRRF